MENASRSKSKWLRRNRVESPEFHIDVQGSTTKGSGPRKNGFHRPRGSLGFEVPDCAGKVSRLALFLWSVASNRAL